MRDSHRIVVDDITKDEAIKSKVVKTVSNGVEQEFEVSPYMEDLAKSIVDDLYNYLEKGLDLGSNKSDVNNLYSFSVLNQIYEWLIEEVEFFKSQGYAKKYIVEQIIYSDDWVDKINEKNSSLAEGVEMYLPKGVFFSLCSILLERLLDA